MTMRNIYILLLFLAFVTTQPVKSQENSNYRTDGTLRRIYTPILMYHYISELPPEPDDIRLGLTIPPHQFADHISYLHSQNYQTISMEQLDTALRHGTQLPPNPIMLTFDDGHIDHYTTVKPILEQYGYKGIFYIATAFTDENRTGYMNWQQVNELAASGMWVEPHSKNHVELTNRSYDYLIYEIVGSIESIEQHTGYHPTSFAYPVGRYDQTTLRVMRTLDIRRSVTTLPGAYHTTNNVHEITRLRVTPEMGVPGLAQMLRFYRDLN